MAKVLLIGWDAADWKIINKLMDNGQMPALEGLINQGSMGNLATLEPPMSPILWTSIATGKLADKHGILGFTEPTLKGVRPTTNLSRKTKAIWNILSQLGYKTHVIGWWPSHPAEHVNGIMISNFFHASHQEDLANGTVYPPNLSPLFAHLRVLPEEITNQHLLPFVPDGAIINQDEDRSLQNISRLLSEASSIQNAATWIMDHMEWDFLAVYFNAIDMFCHYFMQYHPPKMEQVSQSKYNLYKEVVNSAYRFHDMMLEAMLKKIDNDTTVILLSDHGFYNDHLRPTCIPNEPANPVVQHRNQGILVIKGPGIKKDELIHGASLLNITPTILTLFGQPSGKDMDGVPLVQVFEDPQLPQMIESWDEVEGENGVYSCEGSQTEVNQALIQQLVELGYIDPPDPDIKKAIQNATNEINYNLARVYMSTNRYSFATPLLSGLTKQMPHEGRFAVRLARCYMESGEYSTAELTLAEFYKYVSGNSEERNDQKNNIYYWSQQAMVAKSDLLLLQDKAEEAVSQLEKMLKDHFNSSGLLLKLGNAYTSAGKYELSEQYFKKALKLNPELDRAFAGLSFIAFQHEKYEEAANLALDAIGLNYNVSLYHYYLAKSLIGLENYAQASEALEVCLKFQPGFGTARNLLINIYNKLNLPGKANDHLQFIADKNKGVHDPSEMLKKAVYLTKNIPLSNPIIVVSGLPRSGTSAMMQMLEAGGLTLFTDSLRKADESNPKGYYEHEAVKGLARNNHWMDQAQGKAVKIISHLLRFIPPRLNYRVICMERDLGEIIASQHRMLVRNGKRNADTYPGGLSILFRQQILETKEWIKKQPNIDVLYINYTDLVRNPIPQAKKIIDFLGIQLDVHKMAKSVDINLYREKKFS